METLSLPATLTLANARVVAAQLGAQLSAQTRNVDASGLQQFDSSAVAVLLDLQRKLAEKCRARHFSGDFAEKSHSLNLSLNSPQDLPTLTIDRTPAGLQQLASAYGVNTLLALR